MKKNIEKSDIIFYTTPKGDIAIEVYFLDETVWLTQKRMADLFDVEVHTINYHLKEIFKSGELDEKSTIRKIRIVQKEGERSVEREPIFYNLDAIISVGYRVNSDEFVVMPDHVHGIIIISDVRATLVYHEPCRRAVAPNILTNCIYMNCQLDIVL